MVDPTNTSGWSDGWSYSLTTDINLSAGAGPCTPGSEGLRLIMPDGSSHQLYGTGGLGGGYYEYWLPGCGSPTNPLTGTFYTADGTYLRVNVDVSNNWTVYFPDGRTAGGGPTASAFIADRNGNKITIGGSGTSTTLTDDLNRTISITHLISPNVHDVITQTGYNGASLQWTVNWTTVTLTSTPAHNYLCIPGNPNPCSAAGLNQLVVSSIQLPTGLTYQFQSDVNTGWGQVSQMTLPSGAVVTYTYSNNWDVTNATPGVIAYKTLYWTEQEDSSPRSETSSYSFTNVSSYFTNPDGGTTTHYFYDPDSVLTNPFAGLVYKVTQPDSSTVERIWAQNVPYGVSGNPYVQTELTSVANGASPLLAAGRGFTYDRNNNPTQISETDWFPYANIIHVNGDPNQPVTSFTGAITLRTTQNSYVIAAGTATTDYTLVDGNGYWNNLAYQLLSFPSRSVVTGIGPGSITEFTYDSGGAFTKANMTQQRQWDSTKGAQTNPLTASNAIVVNNVYDSYGNLTSTQNPRGYTTTYTFDPTNHLYVTQEVDNGTRTFNFTRDFNTGVKNTESDVQHPITRTFGYDAFARLATVQEGSVRERLTSYDDANRVITEKSDRLTFGDYNSLGLTQVTRYDQLGRVREAQDPAGNITQYRTYIAQNTGYTYKVVSNPYITQTESTMGWTRTKYDTLGRVVEVNHFSGSTLPAPWGSNSASTGLVGTTYSPDTTNLVFCNTTVDEASISRTNCIDGLGRLIRATENGISTTTTYAYDALDSLISVTQPGSTARTFSYSSLKRLISATNPESGTTSYTYDANGNVATRTDARGVLTTYGVYTALDQVSSKTYSDGTPTASYSYNAGWLTQVSSSASTYTYTGFDALGRATGATQTTSSVAYPFTMTYYPFMGVKDITYPNSNRKFTTGYDNYGRANTLSGQIGTNPVRNYVTATSFATTGAVLSQTLGNTLTETRTYNSRLQPTQIQLGSLLTLGYGYSATQNNGNLATQTITRSGSTWTDTYGYDGVNRLTSASEAGAGTWSQTYGYDALGNRWLSAYSNLPAPTSEVPQASTWFGSNNRITAPSPWTYDAAGNVLAVGGMTRSFTYDGENRQKTANVNGTATTYTYDGDGHRVTKLVGGTTTVFVYDPLGNLAQEYGTATDSGTKYLTTDALGSTRLVTTSAGALDKSYDYVPFGEEIRSGYAGRGSTFPASSYPTSPTGTSLKFTGQERDAESGLDNFLARYYSGPQGRFTSADEPLADQGADDPQSWNLFSYGRNNPLRYTDPTGQACVSGGGNIFFDDNSGGSTCAQVLAPTTTVTVTAQWEQVVLMVVPNMVQTLDSGSKMVQNTLQTAWNWWSRPRDPTCMAGATGTGSAIGGGAGLLGVAGGPAVGVTEPTGIFIGGSAGYAGGLFSCMSNSGPSSGSGRRSGSGGGLSAAVRKKLGNLAERAGEKVSDVIRSRGGTASNVNQAGQWADKTLEETAKAALGGDETAETAIKIAKQASRLGQKY